MTDDQTLEMLSAMPALTGRTDVLTFDRAYENLAGDPASQSQRQALASRLAAKKAEAGAP